MESNLFQGARIRISNLQHIHLDGVSKETHKPAKDEVFVCIVLGTEKKKVKQETDVISKEEALKVLQDLVKGKGVLKNPKKLMATVTSLVGRIG
jgi:hypothetical protein